MCCVHKFVTGCNVCIQGKAFLFLLSNNINKPAKMSIKCHNIHLDCLIWHLTEYYTVKCQLCFDNGCHVCLYSKFYVMNHNTHHDWHVCNVRWRNNNIVSLDAYYIMSCDKKWIHDYEIVVAIKRQKLIYYFLRPFLPLIFYSSTNRRVIFLHVQNRFYPSTWWVDGFVHKAMTWFVPVVLGAQKRQFASLAPNYQGLIYNPWNEKECFQVLEIHYV